MRAITYSAFGPAADVLTLSEIETPAPKAGEVLVRVHLSGVNPSDVKARAGGRPGVTKPPYPQIIPHSDGAGIIEAVGTGVDPARIGERVWLWNGQWQRAQGTCAEYIALPSAQAVPLGDHSFQTGASLGIPALTAAQCVLGGGSVEGKTLLVSGGGGSVGFMAVQFAKWAGARVIATASAGPSTDQAQAAGADLVLDHRSPTLADDILQATSGNLVYRAVECEFGANIDTLAAVMSPNSTIAAYGSAVNMAPTLPFGPLLFKGVKIDITLIYILPEAERAVAIDHIHRALAEGALTARVHKTYALEETAKAHEAVEAAHRYGAILVNTV
ncbi:NADPH:quinone reductase [Lentibacter sp. XHP0401]|uniref:NADPH:quinone reductase n=1 Tax=Lentibacter sp. XHP0401 TaxID=2984334 RepID=UPI0021E7BCA1|nr:NADPH:quinone reductase [Lentibacter sp. XHP0401]MCV2894558.1 NADPH:quinone reductase [Lentibacter sp. XHP0401]